MKLPVPGSFSQRCALALALMIFATIFLVSTLKSAGLILAIVLTGVVYVLVRARPDAAEQTSLRTSIELSAEDIGDVINEYEEFATGSSADSIADRTLHRPALIDLDCSAPTIEAFHYEMAGARRFLRRLKPRLESTNIEIDELETLLRVTDRRAAELKEAWLAARREAFALGTNYTRRGDGESSPRD